MFASRIPVPEVPERPDRYLRVEYGALVRPTAALLMIGMILSLTSLPLLAATWQWWVFLVVSFGMTEALTFGSLNGARGIIFVPLLYLFVGLTLDFAWRVGARRGRAVVALLIAGTIALSAWSTWQYFEWAQSEGLLTALEPAVRVEEFPAWQAYVLEWTARPNPFFNVGMWKDHQRSLQQGSGTAPAQ